MKKLIFACFVTLFVITACSDKIENTESIVVEFGTACGWCAGQEFIKVSNSKVEYTRNIPCGDNKGITSKDKKLSNAEWNAIKDSFDYNLFLTLNHEECNVCVDGCDEILKITKDGNEHQISYSPTTEIEGMENLLEKLNQLITEFHD